MQLNSSNILNTPQPSSFLLSSRPYRSPKKILSIITKDPTLPTVLKSDPQTPLASNLQKSCSPRLSTSIGLQKKSEKLNNLSLYRYPIPADLINIHIGHSDRPTTVKIFKNRLEETKIEDEPTPMLKKEPRAPTTGWIKRNDEMNSIKVLVDRGLKDYNRKQKEKKKGSMFVTDLWSLDYERNVIRATQIDKELKKDNSVDRVPLESKFNKLVDFYQRKSIRKLNTNDTVQSLFARSPRNELIELKRVTPLDTEEDQASKEISQDRADQKERTTPEATNTPDYTPKTRIVVLENAIVKKRLKSIGSEFKNKSLTERNKSNIAIQVDEEIIQPKERCQTENDNDETFRLTTKHNSSHIVAGFPFSTRSMSIKPEGKLTPGLKPKGFTLSRKTSKGDAFSTRGFGHSFLLGKMRHTERDGKKAFTEESSEALGDLIGRCNTELDEKDDCLMKLDELKKVYHKKKKMVNKESAREKMKGMIEEFKYMVELRNSNNPRVAFS